MFCIKNKSISPRRPVFYNKNVKVGWNSVMKRFDDDVLFRQSFFDEFDDFTLKSILVLQKAFIHKL